MNIWQKRKGEVNIAFRKGDAFDAVTAALEQLHETKPEVAAQLARRIARNLGVVAQGRQLSDDDLEDRAVFRNLKSAIGPLPFSDEDKQALIDLAKASDIVTEP